MDLDMDLDMDLSGASPLAAVRSAGGLSRTCLGPVWGFPADYGAISWGLSGTCLKPNDDFESNLKYQYTINTDFACGLFKFLIS